MNAFSFTEAVHYRCKAGLGTNLSAGLGKRSGRDAQWPLWWRRLAPIVLHNALTVSRQ
jgi:hypothetical protein